MKLGAIKGVQRGQRGKREMKGEAGKDEEREEKKYAGVPLFCREYSVNTFHCISIFSL